MNKENIELTIKNRITEKLAAFKEVLKGLLAIKSLDDLGRDSLGRSYKAKAKTKIERDSLGRRI